MLQIRLFSLVREFTARTVTILTWSGQRGGVSAALALSLLPSPSCEDLVTIMYAVVVFSILVQRLMINRVLGGSVRASTSIDRGCIDRVHDSVFPIWYIDIMSSMNRIELCSSSQARGFACVVVLLCCCVVVQMLGVPATFVDLLSSDALGKLEPASEDHTTVSLSAEPERPRLLRSVTEPHPVRRLPLLTTSVFHPPSL
ncbi:MAG: hypothetical protein KF682_18895 [Nitrospira sp.]|nr:hypothetical protein [Nitrospira sp.]